MAEPIIIGSGVCKWVKDANTKMITLQGAVSGTSFDLLEGSGRTTYQVPAGKKLIIVKIFFENHSTTDDCRIYSGASSGATTNQITYNSVITAVVQ